MNDLKSDDFISMQSLLDDGIGIGAIATAIEKVGIYGWDRFDRFANFKPGGPEAERALDVLARSVARTNQSGVDHGSGDDEPMGNPWYEFGWPTTQRPDFDAISEGLAALPVRPGSVKGSNADLRIIGFQRDLLLDRIPQYRGVVFKSNGELIEALAKVGQGYPGLSASSLEKKFAAADRLLKFEAD